MKRTYIEVMLIESGKEAKAKGQKTKNKNEIQKVPAKEKAGHIEKKKAESEKEKTGD